MKGCAALLSTAAVLTAAAHILSLSVAPNLCSKGQFMCSSHHCIAAKHVCDGIWDCINGTDEDHCDGINCTFDTGFCGFSQETKDDFNWSRTNQPTPTSSTGPDRDHTTGHGFYIYIETSDPRVYDDKAQLISDAQKATGPNGTCLTFWYHMYGHDINTLNVYLQTADNRTLLWTRSKADTNIWIRGRKHIRSQYPYQVVFEGTVGSGYLGDIALDDISLVQRECPDISCGFEVDMCGYSQDRNDTLRWLRKAPYTMVKGPNVDHTTNSRNGHYMYLYTQTPSQHVGGDTARLTSPSFPPTQSPRCLTFWYNMYNNDTGLDVYVKSPRMTNSPAWTKNVSQGFNWWYYGTVDIDTKNTFQVVFEGVVKGNHGGIAIDDIRFVDGKCLPGSCTFEYDMCGYTQGHHLGDQFDWARNAGDTLSNGTGPSVDHTLGTNAGFYMYVEASGRSAKDRAWLYSQYQAPTNQSCLSFWYFMYGSDIGTLRVYQVNKAKSIQLWAKAGDQGAMWINSQVNIISTVSYQIVFDSQIGAGDKGDIAIDDIFLTAGLCTSTVSTTTAAVTTQNSSVTTSPTLLESHQTSPVSTYADFRQVIYLQCFHHGWLVTVDISKLSPRPANVTNIYMGTDSCTGSLQGDLLVFNQTYGQCNTHAEVVDGKMTFSNYLLYIIPNSFHIIRDIRWEYNIQCSHLLVANGTVHINPTLNVTKQGSSAGQIAGSPIEVSMFKDSSFQNPLHGTTSVGSSVYVQVISLSHPDVVMVLDSCEASVGRTSPSQQKPFPLIEQQWFTAITTPPTQNPTTMAKSLKRQSTEVADNIDDNKIFKPEVISISKEELMSKLDKDGIFQHFTTRCKVSDLPKNVLFEILSHETFKLRGEDLCKVILSSVVKREGDKNFDVLLKHQYSEALHVSSHMMFTGQGSSKNNRTFNILKFFNCGETMESCKEGEGMSQS